MWRDYFPNAEIHGIDIRIPEMPDKERIVMHAGSQEDIKDLEKLICTTGSDFDLIIDDGGHTMAQQQISLGFLFPHVKSGGIYILEDLHTSFMKTIEYYTDGNVSESLPTGVEEGKPTSFDLIDSLSKFEHITMPYISEKSVKDIFDNLKSVAIFDPEESHKHITSILHKM